MARFDRSAPFEVVGGAPGVAYSQYGRLFNNGGYEVELVEVGEGDNKRKIGQMKPDATPALTGDEEDEFAHARDQEIPIAQWHWRKVKAACEQYGHKWVDRDNGVAFLEGRLKDEG